MQFQLTPSVNVPAERAKLRRLRNEINADAQARLTYERNYTARGYRRAQLPDVSTLDAQAQGGHGRHSGHVSHGAGAVRAGAALDVPAAAANLPETQASGGGRCGGACRLGGEGVKA